jgi:flagellar basal body-associated protein FliL
MPKRNIAILVLAIVAVVAVAVVVTFFGVQQAPTDAIIEGPGTELEEAGEPTMEPGPEDPPQPEPSEAPPAQ